MKTFLVASLLLIVAFACKQADTKKPFNLVELPAEWIHLTKTDTGYIIYNSCDAGNSLYTIGFKPKPNFLMHGQQEDYPYQILDCYQIANDTIVIHAMGEGFTQPQDIKFVWYDKQKQVGRFITTFATGYTSNELYVTDKMQKNFPVYNQPCKECWGDECDGTDTSAATHPVSVDTSGVMVSDTTKK